MRPLLLCICLAIAAASFARTTNTRRIILIGNGYEAVKNKGAFLDIVRAAVPFDSGTLVLYLGNNAAPGDTAALRREADLVEGTDAQAMFIPGFLEWRRGSDKGYENLLAQERYLKSLDRSSVKFYPEDGCPGPTKIDIGEDAVMFIMDSQWWLHDGVKPGLQSSCKYRTQEDILAEIEDIAKDEFDNFVLFVTHHPMENTGIHSGTFGIKQHLFPLTDLRGLSGAYVPLPILGSLYPLTSNAVSSRQDLQNSEYQAMVTTGFRSSAGVDRALEDLPNVVFVAGQEHNLQVLKRDGRHYVNSGATGVPTRVRDNKYAEFVSQKQGFIVLELSDEKRLQATSYTIAAGKATVADKRLLADYSHIPPLARDTARLPMIAADSFSAPVNPGMARVGWLKRVMIGENYRKTWSTPVKMEVLHLDRVNGGLKIKGMGGGHESRSLQVKDANDVKRAFRTSNKNLDAVIPEGFQKTVASDYIQDMLSASHPFGALVVTGLQERLGITQAEPRLYFMPNDTALEAFKPLFANQVGLMEERKPSRNDIEPVGTTEALNDMLDQGNHRTEQSTYLKIRLMDFLIADFDRHHNQYNWGRMPDGMYYPIPKDRDQAFYHNKGLIMAIARHGGYGFMTNFPYRIRKMENMGIIGSYMDNVFMNRLTAADWQQGISDFTAALTDEAIDSAVRRFPPEMYALNGSTIAAKLKSRRESIAKRGMGYYRFIGRRVNVLGGNTDDVFRIYSNDSGLAVKVYARDSNGNEELRYDRWFDPKITRELRLFGFNGNDRFVVDPSAHGHTRLRIVGGSGSDTFNIDGRVRNYLYDLRSEANVILDQSRTTKLFSNNASVNEFSFRENLHNSFSLPLITLGYNIEDGVIAGIGLGYKTNAFRKDPYASSHRLTASFATASRAYMLRYKGEFVNLYRHFDLLICADNYNPVLRNFFGFGNETIRDTTVPVRFYRTRYDYVSADLMVRRRFHRGKTMSVSAGPSFYHYWYDQAPNRGRVLENPELVGLDSGVYEAKTYAGGKASFLINTLNNELVPTRGIHWLTELTALKSLNEGARSLTKLSSALDVYAVLNEPNRLLATIHLGGGHIFSDHFEYFQALTLGGNNYLRGYRVNRFSGASMAYASAELKMKLFAINGYLLKGDLGLVGFNDVGRVWMPGEKSTKWHHGYGGGIYLMPYNALMLSAVVGLSEEDQLFNFSVGTKLNVVFQGI